MNPQREAHLIRIIPTLATLDEALGFRQQLHDQGERMTGDVMRAMERQIAVLVKREGKR